MVLTPSAATIVRPPSSPNEIVTKAEVREGGVQGQTEHSYRLN